MWRGLHNERGQSIAIVGIGLGTTVLLAFAVVAVDIGRLAFTATEVQTLADTTAMTGALALRDGANPVNHANTVAGGNSVEGTSATAAATTGMNDPCPSPPCAGITLGSFDLTTWTAGGCGPGSLNCFSPGGASPNGVLSTARATVNNILAPMLGSPASTVTKTAVGAIGGLGSGRPTVPLALCDCAFPPDCNDPSCLLPVWTTPTWTNTAAWTGFDAGHGDSTIVSFVPSPCEAGNTPPNLTAGNSTTDVTNGAGSPPFDALRCMNCTLGMCTDASPCLAPVFACTCPLGPTSGLQSVVGFAELVIDTFHCTGGGPNGSFCPCGTNTQGNVDSVGFHSVFRRNVTGPPGGGSFGVIVAGMVG